MYIMKPYDDCLRHIIKYGVIRQNRNGDPCYNTLSIFGYMMKFDVSTYFPMVTRRKMYPKAIWAELLWMLSGSTNVHDLERLGSKIWSPWIDHEFEKEHNYADGDMGPSYGWSFRHFGGEYLQRNIKQTYKDSIELQNDWVHGYDQIQYVLDELKSNPHSRRAVISLWDASVIHKVRLPFCHISNVYTLEAEKFLSASVHIRSSDVPVGLPANIQFYTTLLYMMAQQLHVTPFNLIVYLDDAHVYCNQLEAVSTYLKRKAHPSPKLALTPANTIDSYTLDNFSLTGYTCGDHLAMPVVV
jgi:thymidylate synthase